MQTAAQDSSREKRQTKSGAERLDCQCPVQTPRRRSRSSAAAKQQHTSLHHHESLPPPPPLTDVDAVQTAEQKNRAAKQVCVGKSHAESSEKRTQNNLLYVLTLLSMKRIAVY